MPRLRRMLRSLLALTAQELAVEAKRLLPTGSGVWREVYRDAVLFGRFEPERYVGTQRSVDAWRGAFTLDLPEVVTTVSEPGPFDKETIKAVLRTHDGLEIECVRIPMRKDVFTLCVSSQVGCKLACTFCETGRMGLLRNLEAWEIIAQLVVARSVLGWEIHNIVFQGMGEPLDNADNVIQALRILNDRRGLNYGQRRLCVCTSGVPEGIARLGELRFPRMDVSISLNAADDALRSHIMPVNRKHNLDEVQRALIAYPKRANFVFGVHYCLIPGVNDSAEDAERVAQFCAPIGRVMINLIPYNPTSQPIGRAPSDEEVETFVGHLTQHGLPVRRRLTKGRSVMAACGQLGNVELRKQRKERLAQISGAP